ncbi:MAG: thioredoxin family protein [Thiohalocapsa sp.]|uniref:protein-disulfide reductase DsbD family protein n=1 Tax=Thiohalocapsa sp. TaxID=2497641 RepID=UPI0025D85311|nr:thioredoxin family protein [Thiohalocapsa sp.]MCG6943552.1 thioredoxin family protein [Thiohalocapsa sp.]
MPGLLLAGWLAAVPASIAGPSIDAAVFDDPAASGPVITENVHARLLAERSSVAPGGALDLALVLDIRPHWHTYWRNPGDSGEPPRIRWHLPDGVTAGPIRWPLPEPIPVGPLVNYGYSGRAVHLVALSVPAGWPAGEPVRVAAEATWLVCDEACIPERGHFELTLATAIDPSAGPSHVHTVRLFESARERLPRAGVVAATLDRGEDALTLRVPAAALPGRIDEVYFFPYEWGLVSHAAGQGWTLSDVDGADVLSLDLVPGEVAASAPATGLLKIRGGGADIGLRIDAGTKPGARPGDDAAKALPALPQTSGAGVVRGLALALGFALLGGLLLNLMPCVFPVLAIKALGLAGQGGARFRARALHGLAYASGVLVFFLGLGLLLLVLRAAGTAVGWGFQLQSPLFVTLMAYLFLVLGMSLAGAFTLGTSLMGIGGGTDQQTGHKGAFATGALAALVAAPCTAPFMGAALGYAMTVPWPGALAVVLALGLGMALPFLLLASWPRLARALPRPGPWMETLKQALAFPMFATAAWLLWVLAVQSGPSGLARALTGALVLAFALWVQERTRTARAPWPRVGAGAAVLGLAAALWLGVGAMQATGDRTDAGTVSRPAAARSALAAEPYSAAKLAAARADGRPVFVNMTAAWCITCLVNERVALRRAAVARAFAEQDVLYLKGDWTNRDAAITDYLAGFGRNGVPIYVFYPPGGEPRVLPQVLTETVVLDRIGAG